MRQLLMVVMLQLGAGCPGQSGRDTDPGCKVVQIGGRVVDLESCVTTAGCQGVANVRVALFYDSSVVSDATRPDGAFLLSGVPAGVRNYLLVADGSENATYLSSLEAVPVVTKNTDTFGVELHALRREGGIYSAINQALGAEVRTKAIYFGQVANQAQAVAGAAVLVTPAAPVHFVSCNPRLNAKCGNCAAGDASCDPGFLPSATATRQYGEFAVIAPGDVGDLSITISADRLVFPPVVAPVGTGYITIGMHTARSGSPLLDGAKDAGAKDAGAVH